MYTDEVKEIILTAKPKMPSGWKIVTYENWTAAKLEILIPMGHFETFTVPDQIRIAEITNGICESIVRSGLPCEINKVDA